MHGEKKWRLRVLVADDNDDVRRAIVRLLSDTFEIVGDVCTGAELVQAAQTLRPDVIASDLKMPLLSGLEAMKVLRDVGDTVPFVLITAGVRDAQRWIDLGVFAVVDKSEMDRELIPAVLAAAAARPAN
jgi:CheY-like chemotaxis protein